MSRIYSKRHHASAYVKEAACESHAALMHLETTAEVSRAASSFEYQMGGLLASLEASYAETDAAVSDLYAERAFLLQSVNNTWRASSLANLNERLARENEERVDLRRHIAHLVVVHAVRMLESQEQRLEMERAIGDLRTQLADTQAAELQYAAAASHAARKAEQLRIQVTFEASKAAAASKTEVLASEAARKSEEELRMQLATADLHTEAQRAGGRWGGSRMEMVMTVLLEEETNFRSSSSSSSGC